jgi:hypothetical protein
LTHVAGGDEELQRRLTSQFAIYILQNKDDYDMDFSDVEQKPHILWSLADKTVYGDLKKVLVAVHQNPAGASGGQRNHKTGKRVHSLTRSRVRQHQVESGTAIAFNSK